MAPFSCRIIWAVGWNGCLEISITRQMPGRKQRGNMEVQYSTRRKTLPDLRGGHLRIFTDGGHIPGTTEGAIGVVIRVEKEYGSMYCSTPLLMYGKPIEATDSYATEIEAIHDACSTIVKACTHSWDQVVADIKGTRVTDLANIPRMEIGPDKNGYFWEAAHPRVIKEI